MKRTCAMVVVALLILPWTAAAAGPGPRSGPATLHLPGSVLEAVWNWAKAALPWLQGEPASAAKSNLPPGPVPPRPRPPNHPNGGSCIDPDGVRVPCGPKF